MSVPLTVNWLPYLVTAAAGIIAAGIGLFAYLIGGTP